MKLNIIEKDLHRYIDKHIYVELKRSLDFITHYEITGYLDSMINDETPDRILHCEKVPVSMERNAKRTVQFFDF